MAPVDAARYDLSQQGTGRASDCSEIADEVGYPAFGNSGQESSVSSKGVGGVGGSDGAREGVDAGEGLSRGKLGARADQRGQGCGGAIERVDF